MPNNIPSISSPMSQPVSGSSGLAPASRSTFTGASSAVVSKANHGQSGLKKSLAASLKSLSIRSGEQISVDQATSYSSVSSAPEPTKIPAWKEKREAQKKARDQLISKAEGELTAKASSTNQIQGTSPSKEEVETVFNTVKNTTFETKERLHALTELLSRPGGAESFMNLIGSDAGKLDIFLKLESKALIGASDQKVRQGRLEKLIPHFSDQQIQFAVTSTSFQSLMNDSISGNVGGYSKTIMDSLSVSQFQVLVSGVNSRDQASGMMKMVEKLGLSDSKFDKKLHAILSKFSGFSPEVQSVVMSSESFISPKIRFVSDVSLRADLNKLLSDFKKSILSRK